MKLALALALAAGTTAHAVHPQNAGPQQVELKFKLPPPKPLSAEEALKTFKVAKGFHVELFASEPMIECPVAISWDERGRAWVLEMRGYMHDIEAKGEDQPNCVISILEDTDGDGRADKRTVFADKLTLARALMCVNGGALVAEPPVLWFMKDTDGDGRADVKEQVDAYGSRTGQPEHMANSPTWFLDNWIYNANHPVRYKLKDGKFIPDGVPQRGQWGMSQDDYGRAFFNFNSDFLRANFVPEALYKRNPNWPGGAGTGVQVVKDQSVWPIAPTPGVNRGYEAKTLTADGKLTNSTATCGAGIYRGGLFGAEFAGNAFVPEPSANLVKRFALSEKDAIITGANVAKGEEFLASTDERFRPVNAYTGPDGALWLADMYRGVIQHKGFLTHYLIANIKARALEQPLNMGRIWRIVPDGAKPQAVKLPAEPAKLVAMLGHANGWVRDTAQRLLVEKKNDAVLPALVEVVKSGTPLAKIHALWTIEGIGIPQPDAVKLAFADKDAKVRAAAARVADRSLVPELAKLANDPSLDVQIAVAFNASAFPEGGDIVFNLARSRGANPLVRDALLSGLRGRELETIEALLANSDKPAPAEMFSALAFAVMAERRSARVEKLITLIAAQSGPTQLALLEGASGKNAPKGAPKVKLQYLNAEAPALSKLAASADAKARPLVAALDARVAWPGKPGVPPPPVVIPLNADEQRLFEIGKTSYQLCAACHQPNGQGMDGLAPALVDSEWVLGNPDIIAKVVLHGLSGPIKVNGQSFALDMAPLGAALTDEQLAGIITYIRREWEHTAAPVTIAQVKKIRDETRERTKAWTADELGMVKKK
jgi:mono/diheme cytochrome c family protein/glucose/arabinose dehydrogenase